MKLTNSKTTASIELVLAVAQKKYKSCSECIIQGECTDWVDAEGQNAMLICGCNIGLTFKKKEPVSETKECTYCIGEDSETMPGQKGWINIRLDEDNDIIITDGFDAEYVHINYCPMCGRKL